MMTFKLFKYESYCETCTEYVQPKGHFNIKKYTFNNNEYKIIRYIKVAEKRQQIIDKMRKDLTRGK